MLSIFTVRYSLDFFPDTSDVAGETNNDLGESLILSEIKYSLSNLYLLRYRKLELTFNISEIIKPKYHSVTQW